SLLGTCHDDLDIDDDASVDAATTRLLARTSTLAAGIMRSRAGKEVIAPDPSPGFVENFLHMAFGDEKEFSPEFVSALDMLFTLHADHEQNCSTSTVRMVGSSEASLYASIT